MMIFVTGLRGIPNIPGGIEKHCQELYPRIAAKGHQIYICRRRSYVADRIYKWHNVNLIDSPAPRQKHLEAIMHTAISLLLANKYKPDILHIHGIGPSLLVPMARSMGFKVVVTNHGPDYNRQKWGVIAKAALKLGEKIGSTFANEVIAISITIKNLIRSRSGKDAWVIANGVTMPRLANNSRYLKQIGAIPDNYVLAVARLVPEKGLHDLIAAINSINHDLQLVIAGDADHESDYCRNLRQLADKNPNIILTGYTTGDKLNQLYSHARLFVLPSYHEGLPIVLLEALSYGLSVIVSDIPANIEIGLPEKCYFKCGDIDNLRAKIIELMGNKPSDDDKSKTKSFVQNKYNWDRIAEKTITVYKKILGQ